MLKRFPQLQSGFVCATEDLVDKPIKDEKSAIASLLAGTPTRTQEEFFYSPVAENLINEILQNPLSLRTFEFQEKVLELTSKLFEKQPFTFFIHLQEDSKGMSASHILFMEETIKIALGLIEQRSVSLQTWGSILSSANTAIGGFRASTIVNKFKYTGFTSMSLADFILSWIRNAGYSDLIITLQVIFGRRTLHGSFGNKR